MRLAPLALALPLLAACGGSGGAEGPTEAVPLMIEGRSFLVADVVPALSFNYRACAMKRYAIDSALAAGGIGAVVALENESVAYDPNNALQPEPDWAALSFPSDRGPLGMLEGRYVEAFDGERYARYDYAPEYEIAEDASCALVRDWTVAFTLDDGERRTTGRMADHDPAAIAPGVQREPIPYEADFDSGFVTSQARPADVPDIPVPAALALANTITPADAAMIRETLGVEQRPYREPDVPTMDDGLVVAGRGCDQTLIEAVDGRICAMAGMPVYPSSAERPVLLRIENAVLQGGERRVVWEAERVTMGEPVPDALFRPDPSLTLPAEWKDPRLAPPARRPKAVIDQSPDGQVALAIDMVEHRTDLTREEKDRLIAGLRRSLDPATTEAFRGLYPD